MEIIPAHEFFFFQHEVSTPAGQFNTCWCISCIMVSVDGRLLRQSERRQGECGI